jgi:hypothetical protein
MQKWQIEKCMKRRLSDAESVAIDRVIGQLSPDRRKAKRLLRQARTKARKAEIAARQREGQMSEPSPNDIRRAKDAFSLWQPGNQFVAEVEKFNAGVPSEKLWGNPYKFLREALSLAGLCRHLNPTSVRISEDGRDPPDAWIRFKPDEEDPLEITEVLEPNRRRGDEYKKYGFSFATHISDEQVAARDEEIVAALTTAIEAKAKYDFRPRLLVYLNYPHRESTEPKIKEALVELQKKFSNQFRAIHVVTDRKVLT